MDINEAEDCKLKLYNYIQSKINLRESWHLHSFFKNQKKLIEKRIVNPTFLVQSRSKIVNDKLPSLSEVNRVCKKLRLEEHVHIAKMKIKENLISPVIFRTVCKGETHKKPSVSIKVHDFKFRSPSKKRAD